MLWTTADAVPPTGPISGRRRCNRNWLLPDNAAGLSDCKKKKSLEVFWSITHD